MIHEVLPVGMLACNCSVFGDEATREGLVVDPGDEIGRILEIIGRNGLTVKAIVVTHAHIDHIGGAQKLHRATGAPVYMNLEDSEMQAMLGVQAEWLGMETPEAVAIDVPANDGDRLVVGSTEFRVLHTPGHTPGHVSFFRTSDRVLITGDAVVGVKLNSFWGTLLSTQGLSGPPWYTTWSRRAARESVERLAQLEPTVLAGGHGKPMTGTGTAAAVSAFAGLAADG